MNERLKELVKQVTVRVPSQVINPDTEEVEPWLSYGQQIYHNVFDKDKFAELIIKECIDLFADDLETMDDSTGRGCRNMIKKHFGVSE